jgi:hypothetical protein
MSHSAFGHNWTVGFEPGAWSLMLPARMAGVEVQGIALSYIDLINLRRTGD